MILRITPKHVLGAAAILAAGAVLASRDRPRRRAVPTKAAEPPKTAEAAVPFWSATTERKAWATGVKEYAAMRSPPPIDSVVVQLAWRIGNQVWPHWDWPANFNASQLFLASADPGRDVWARLLDLAFDVATAGAPARLT